MDDHGGDAVQAKLYISHPDTPDINILGNKKASVLIIEILPFHCPDSTDDHSAGATGWFVNGNRALLTGKLINRVDDLSHQPADVIRREELAIPFIVELQFVIDVPKNIAGIILIPLLIVDHTPCLFFYIAKESLLVPRYPDIRFILVLPCLAQTRVWSREDVEKYSGSDRFSQRLQLCPHREDPHGTLNRYPSHPAESCAGSGTGKSDDRQRGVSSDVQRTAGVGDVGLYRDG